MISIMNLSYFKEVIDNIENQIKEYNSSDEAVQRGIFNGICLH